MRMEIRDYVSLQIVFLQYFKKNVVHFIYRIGDRMNNTIDTINRIFNKIPHIYSELFLNIFSINYSHFSIPHNYNILEHTLSQDHIHHV